MKSSEKNQQIQQTLELVDKTSMYARTIKENFVPPDEYTYLFMAP